MQADCHIHMVLDGENWKNAIARHREAPKTEWICGILEQYRQQGYTYLRDGGDRWGAGAAARELAPRYGITYRTPLSPLCKAGHYGKFIGTPFENLQEYEVLVKKIRQAGGDFIKVMISGLMDFDHFGVLTEPGLTGEEIGQMVHIAHEEGMAIMAHANGAEVVKAAAAAGCDSVEHGAYLDSEALSAMESSGTVWVPTLSTIGNLRGKGRFQEQAVAQILESALLNLEAFRGLVAPGSDAGAWAVPHAAHTEEPLLNLAGIGAERLQQGVDALRRKFG